SSIEISSTEICPKEKSFLKIGSYKDRVHETGVYEISAHEISSTKIGSIELRFTKIGFAEVSLAEVKSAQVCLAEVGPFVWILFSPTIPLLKTIFLFQTIEMVLICHKTYPCL